jgi:pimeloyl-ACP methyl ester carboxylesterase
MRPRHPSASRRSTFVVLASIAIAVAGLLAPPAGAARPSLDPGPALTWHDCGGPFECTRIDVPLDHDGPGGEQISVAMIRLPATDPAHRVGSLFVNPGGPGSSGVDFVRGDARDVLPAQVQSRFDIVGFDPRGVGRSTPIRCFPSVAEQQEFFADVPAFPVGSAQRAAYADQMARLASSCAALNPALLDHLSTANVARDLDVMRAAVGDARLSYAGYSYGTLLGQTYAGLFPDRVRVLALDGVLDPVAWTTGRGQQGDSVPFSLRVGGPAATTGAMDHFLDACQDAGPRGCAFASHDTHGQFDRLMKRLRHHPVVLDEGDGPETFTYADVVDGLRGGLTFPPIWPEIGLLL